MIDERQSIRNTHFPRDIDTGYSTSESYPMETARGNIRSIDRVSVRGQCRMRKNPTCYGFFPSSSVNPMFLTRGGGIFFSYQRYELT